MRGRVKRGSRQRARDDMEMRPFNATVEFSWVCWWQIVYVYVKQAKIRLSLGEDHFFGVSRSCTCQQCARGSVCLWEIEGLCLQSHVEEFWRASVVDPGAKPHRKQLSGLKRELQFFWLSWNVVSARTWSPVLRPCLKPACSTTIWYSLELVSMAWYDGVAAALSTKLQEAQLPQRNSASAAHMEGWLGPPAHSPVAPSGYTYAYGRIRNPQQTYVNRAVH